MKPSQRLPLRTSMAVVALLAAACGGGGDAKESPAGGNSGSPRASAGESEEPEEASEAHEGRELTPEEEMAKAAEETAKSLKEMNAGQDVKAVEPSKLKELLPATFAGCKRKNTESQHISQMGMDMAETKADYQPESSESGDPQAHFRLKITDMGNMKGAMGYGMVAWAMGSIDKETDDGWEKTAKMGSWPSHQQWRNDGNSGTVQVWVGKRFIVEAEGWDTTIDDVRKLAESVGFSSLEALAK